MSYLKFDKSELVNLEYSLVREVIRSNRAGSYASTTIIGCNTRKYHGLLVCPFEHIDNDKHVLLSTLDVTVIQHDKEFNLGIHKYQGDNYVPRGHKYVRDFDALRGSFIIFRVGGVVLSREIILVEKEQQVLIKFTLEDAHSETLLRFKPFLAFRNYHTLSKANLDANTRYTTVKNGIMSRLYEPYPGLYMQFSKKVEFVSFPDWYFNIEYMEEQKRGYDYKEDLFVPGYFEMPIRKGETIVFSASTEEVKPEGLKRKFVSEYNKRIPKNSFKNCLLNSAQQFIVRKDDRTEVVAGFPWFGTWGRDTFVALPGLTLSIGDLKTAMDVIDTIVRRIHNGLFPNTGSYHTPIFNSVDAPLWFFWTLQQYEKVDPGLDIWKKYGSVIKEILNAFRRGTSYNIHMVENGLIYAGEEGVALTWMDASVGGQPVNQRAGHPVEVNALWYNAVCQALKWSHRRDNKFQKEWRDLPEMIKASFIHVFWDEGRGYLADYVCNDFKDFSVRPNQIIPVALDFSPLTSEMKKSILDVVESELLTPRGLRSLSPKNELYRGTYSGNQDSRNRAYHQGTAWPWLLQFFVKGYLDIHKNSGLNTVKKIYEGFEDELMSHGIGTISEIYDGNPPHLPRGAISQGWSVASLLRISEMIENFKANQINSGI
ncbi:MAG: glycogen debranching enzyme family protein [Bacteroidales bacterium]|nr:glycogen debranching enzyme family protein [Bacteroidales bacterium]